MSAARWPTAAQGLRARPSSCFCLSVRREETPASFVIRVLCSRPLRSEDLTNSEAFRGLEWARGLFCAVAVYMATIEHICPKCKANRAIEMGQSSDAPVTSILRCERCGHVWMGDTPDAVRVCPRCGSARLRSVARSASGVGYLRCDECEHLLVEPPGKGNEPT